MYGQPDFDEAGYFLRLEDAEEHGKAPSMKVPRPIPDKAGCSQRGSPVSVRKPQNAAAARSTRKPRPVTRLESVLLLQPWSTAASQTKKKTIARMPRPLSHIG